MSSQTVVSTFSTSNLSLSESSSLPVGQTSFLGAQSFSTSISSSFRAPTTSSGSISSLASSRPISSSIEALLSSTASASLDASSTVAEENKSDMSASPASSSEAANVTSLRAGLPADGSSSASASTSTSVEENTQTSVESSSTPTSESSSSTVISGAASETDDGSTPKPPSAPTTSLTTPTTAKATNTQPAQPGQTTEATIKGTPTTTPVDAKATTSMDHGLPAGASVAVVVTSVNGTTITQISTSLPPTLASPVGVTAIDSSGHTSLTYPAIVTVLSTGTNSDGSLTTETKVVINPTGETSHRIKDPDSFFSNTGAVAGTFVAVGIVVTSIAAFLYLCYRRKRRLRHQLRWLQEMHSPRPQSDNDLDSFHDDPFEDRNAAPEMLQRPRTPPALPEPSRNAYASVPQTATAQDFRGLVAAAPSSGGAFGSVAFKNELADPFNDIYSSSRPIGVAVTTPSLASGHDTPSLYSKQDEESIYDEVDIHSDEGQTNAVAPLTLPARPPRSHLRASNSVEYKTSEYNPSEYRPISPPTTVESSTPPSTPVNATPPSSSHGSTAKQVSPYSVLTRKTVLDIRPRPSQDNVHVARI